MNKSGYLHCSIGEKMCKQHMIERKNILKQDNSAPWTLKNTPTRWS